MSQDLRALMEKLCRELAQSEHSAEVHPAREAQRLGDNPPGRALQAIADHAGELRRELDALCITSQPVGIRIGRLVGGMFSALRHAVFDRLIDTERSYRGTLLGVHHGIGVARLLREVAVRSHYDGLVAFCDRLIAERVPLVEAGESALAWFAVEPHAALASGLRRAVHRPRTIGHSDSHSVEHSHVPLRTPAHPRTLPGSQ